MQSQPSPMTLPYLNKYTFSQYIHLIECHISVCQNRILSQTWLKAFYWPGSDNNNKEMLKPSITCISSFKSLIAQLALEKHSKFGNDPERSGCNSVTQLIFNPNITDVFVLSLCVFKRSPHIHLQSDVIWNTSGMSWGLKCRGNCWSAAARLLTCLRVAQLAVPHSTLWVKVMEEVPQVESFHLQPTLKDPWDHRKQKALYTPHNVCLALGLLQFWSSWKAELFSHYNNQ